jgi:hypothetical protein
VLVVRGAFELKAVLGGKNHIQNLVIEVAPSCRSCTCRIALRRFRWRAARPKSSLAKVFPSS